MRYRVSMRTRKTLDTTDAGPNSQAARVVDADTMDEAVQVARTWMQRAYPRHDVVVMRVEPLR